MQDGPIDIVLALILRKKKNYVDRTNKVRNSWTKVSMMESQKAAEDSLKKKKTNISNLRGFIVLQTQLDFLLSCSRKENSLLILTKAESFLLHNTSFIDQSCAVKMAGH